MSADESAEPCAECWHWAAPLAFRVAAGAPAMTYQGWLVFHWHVVLHQRLGAA